MSEQQDPKPNKDAGKPPTKVQPDPAGPAPAGPNQPGEGEGGEKKEEQQKAVKAVSKKPDVKIKAMRDCRLSDGRHLTPGTVDLVSAEDAAQFCDSKYPGNYSGSGEGHYRREEIVRAVRVA